MIATTAETSYTMGVPPPVAAALAVRSFDAAGHRSPYALFDWATPPDNEPPTAPAEIALSNPDPDPYLLFTLTWTPAVDDVIVAGYEVQISSEHYNRTLLVGDTSLKIPYLGPDVLDVEIRAFDGAGQFGPAAQAAITIRQFPPPPSIPVSPTP